LKKKNSVLCAGLDPAEHEMGRGNKGLSEGVDKTMWALNFVQAVASDCVAIKPNIQYWQDIDGMDGLRCINECATDLGLVVIEDKKLADIGSTNDAGIFYASERAHAVTYSPFAG
jgi:orotidine-5'-phosphate decarboxylase